MEPGTGPGTKLGTSRLRRSDLPSSLGLRVFAAGLIAGGCLYAAAQPAAPAESPKQSSSLPQQAWPQFAAQPAASAAAPATTSDAPAPSARPAPAPAAAQPVKYTLPAGTKVLLSLKSGINTRTARPGDGVYLISSFPVVEDGHVLIPDGAYVQGIIDRVKRAGRVKGRAEINMHFTSIIFPDGQVVPIPGTVNSLPGSDGPQVTGREGTVEQPSGKGHDAANIAKGAGIGAEGGVIAGGVSGHALSGLGYGSLAGAAVGTLYTLLSRGKDISIPAGASVEMVLLRPMSLEAQHYATAGETSPRMQQQFDPLPQRAPLRNPNQP